MVPLARVCEEKKTQVCQCNNFLYTKSYHIIYPEGNSVHIGWFCLIFAQRKNEKNKQTKTLSSPIIQRYKARNQKDIELQYQK